MVFLQFSIAEIIILPVLIFWPTILLEDPKSFLALFIVKDRKYYYGKDTPQLLQETSYLSWYGLGYLALAVLMINLGMASVSKFASGILNPNILSLFLLMCCTAGLLAKHKRDGTRIKETLIMFAICNGTLWSYQGLLELTLLNCVLFLLVVDLRMLREYRAVLYSAFLTLGCEEVFFQIVATNTLKLTSVPRTDIAMVLTFYIICLGFYVTIRKPTHKLTLYIHYWKTGYFLLIYEHVVLISA